MEQAYASACVQRTAAAGCEAFARIAAVRHASPRRTVVFGRFADGSDGVVIVDPGTARRIDGFPCFHPVLSPDGRRIAFERYFRLHARIALRYRGLVAVYDLERSPRGNRDSGADERLAGRVVNPRTMTGDASERWVDGIAWRSSSELHFAVRYDERTHHVRVSFASRPGR
ncbi:MAG: hypothetical protein NVSMB19_00870 [Vulcanimicrobiaceae bacterium]